eukprot:2683063-Alexandrium_andersonii.AAC.1
MIRMIRIIFRLICRVPIKQTKVPLAAAQLCFGFLVILNASGDFSVQQGRGKGGGGRVAKELVEVFLSQHPRVE